MDHDLDAGLGFIELGLNREALFVQVAAPVVARDGEQVRIPKERDKGPQQTIVEAPNVRGASTGDLDASKASVICYVSNGGAIIMDIWLGPWTVDMSIDKTTGQPIADAMGAEAFDTVKNTNGFTPQKVGSDGKPAPSGFTITGKLTVLAKEPNGMHVQGQFTLLGDGTFVNIGLAVGNAWAQAPNTPIDAIQAVADAQIAKILGLIKTGKVKKVR